MLGDTAVAVHPDPAKALDKAEADLQEKLNAAAEKDRETVETQLASLRERRETHLPLLLKLRDMAAAGRMVMLPLVNREIPLITDTWAKPELGSGCVKITPAHDINDYEVGLRCNLPMLNIMNPDGTLNSHAGPYQGLTMKVARKRVVADLDDAELLGEIEDREIDLAHSDRSKTPIEPYLADQWFVRMDQLAQTAMDAVTEEKVQIFPKRYGKGYLDWLSEKRDWPIGRQLWWGHQLPIWSKPVLTEAELESLTNSLQQEAAVLSSDVAFQVETNEELHSEGAESGTVHGAEIFEHPIATVHLCIASEDKSLATHFESQGFVQQTDVLDTWFSSALWPHSTLGWPEKTPELEYFYPTSTLITSRDIITLWVARMVLAGQYNMGEVPFQNVYIHPKILDGYGKTMSKSKGNGVDPLDVIDKFGADALRFSLAYLTTETQDVRMPVEFECPNCNALIPQTVKNRILPIIECKKCTKEFRTQWAQKEEDLLKPRGAVVSERFELGRNFANKLWNASRFVMMNLEGYEAAPVVESELTLEDRWLLSRLASVTQAVTEAVDTFHYADATRALYDFAWDEFCSFYVEMCKSRLADESLRPVVQRVLVHVLDALLRLLHPFIPFLTEEVWHLLVEFAPERGLESPAAPAESVMIAKWPEVESAHIAPTIETQFTQFQSVLGAIREIRSAQNIPPKEPVTFCVRCDQETADLLQPMEAYFVSMARATATGWGESVEAPERCASVSRVGMEILVDVSAFFDAGAERARLEKESGQLAGWITGIEKKLSNENFVSRAPEEVVQGERNRLAELAEQRQAVLKALGALSE